MRQGSQISSYLYDLCIWQFFFLRFIRSLRRCSHIHFFSFAFDKFSEFARIKHILTSYTQNTYIQTHLQIFWWVVRWYIFYRACIYKCTPSALKACLIFVKESSLCALQFSQYTYVMYTLHRYIGESCIPLACGIRINKELKLWMIFWHELHTHSHTHRTE